MIYVEIVSNILIVEQFTKTTNQRHVAEMDEHLGYDKHYPAQTPGPNSRNGYSKNIKIRISINRIKYAKR